LAAPPRSIIVRFFEQLGELSLLAGRTFRSFFQKPWEGKIFLQQLEEIGLRTLPVVSLTAAFGGLVFGLQSYYGFHKYIGQGSEAYGGPSGSSESSFPFSSA